MEAANIQSGRAEVDTWTDKGLAEWEAKGQGRSRELPGHWALWGWGQWDREVLWSILITMMLDDVTLYFSEQEWKVLEKWQQEMNQQIMKLHYEICDFLGWFFSKPDLITWMEQERMLLIRNQEKNQKKERERERTNWRNTCNGV